MCVWMTSPFVCKFHAHADVGILQVGAVEGDDVRGVLGSHVSPKLARKYFDVHSRSHA